MRKYLISGLLTLLAALTISAAGQQRTVTGSVRGGDGPLAGVAVSDGNTVAVTDAAGNYRLCADPRSRFIHVSTPAGYMPPVEDGLVKFYLPADGREGYDFTLTPKDYDDTRHGFIAVADPQVMNESEIELMRPAVEDIAQAAAHFSDYRFHGMGCGDIVFDRLHLYGPFNEAMAGTGIPFYHSIGNHDMDYTNRTHETSYSTYESVFGPAWYSYNVGKIHYVVLDDVFYIGRGGYYIGYLDEGQLGWLERDLELVPQGSTVVVTMHIPSTVSPKDRQRFSFDDVNDVLTNKDALYNILDGYNAHIVSGHYHTQANSEIRDNLYEHNVAALSGAWWQGPVCTDGTPAGYKVFLCDGDELRWVYKSVGYPLDHQLKLYVVDNGQGKAEVLANVWDADSRWKVELFENGELTGEMERIETFDPDAVRIYSDKDNLNHKWIEPTPADHFFRREIDPSTKRVKVQATDRFGDVSVVETALIKMIIAE